MLQPILKYCIILLLAIFTFQNAQAQVKDTLTFYLTKAGTQTTNKDLIYYTQVVIPPDTTVDKTHYTIFEYYTNGKRKLTVPAFFQSNTFMFDGPCMEFFINGTRKSITTYKNGTHQGDKIAYYPNGKLYALTRINTKTSNLELIECRDSTGIILAQNGNGKWVDYDIDFTRVVASGSIKDMKRKNDWYYDKMYFANQNAIMPYDEPDKYVKIDIMPMYKNGIEALYNFFSKNIKHPQEDITGKVYVSFIVEKDGTLGNFQVIRSPSPVLSEEAIRVVKLSSPWVPASAQGKPVRIKYTIPVNFSTDTN